MTNNLSKPLIRWVIGNSSDLGKECLKLSVQHLTDIYKNEVNYLICYNGENDPCEFGIETYKQPFDFFIRPHETAWKLSPPRLRVNSHELILDNDIIIFKSPPEIRQFFSSSKCLISEGLGRNFGDYDRGLPENAKYNSGVIGLPPMFDFEKELKSNIQTDETWNNPFNEQGLVSQVIHQQPHILIPQKTISLAWGDYSSGTCGIHFTGINKKEDTKEWREFKLKQLI